MADKRPTLTVKGPAFTPEFRAKVNKAAKKRGITQAAFVAEVLEREATRVLQGTPEDTPSDNPPPAIVARLEDTDHRISELADQVRKLTEMQQRNFWHKLKGVFTG